MAKAPNEVITESPHEVFHQIDTSSDKFVEQLRALCKQPSVSAQNLGLDETAELVGKLLQEFGFTVEEFSPSKGPPVVFAELRSKTGRRTLVFYNHYDVQPVEPVELWKHPPFSATVEDGRVYARGASDNKGNIVSRLMAISAFLKVTGTVPCNLKWVIEGEEEIGSPHFSEFITRYKERLAGDSAVWEFGGLDYEDRPLVTLGLKGMLYVEFRVQTALKDSHSARAAVVENPAWRLVRMLDTITDEDGRILVEGWYDDVKPFTQEKLAGKLRQHLVRHGFADVEVSLQAENPAARTPIDAPIAKIATRAGREVFRKEPVMLVTSAASGPMHYFTNTLGLPTVAIGCNHAKSNTHAPNENQRIDVFVQGSKWVARVIEEV